MQSPVARRPVAADPAANRRARAGALAIALAALLSVAWGNGTARPLDSHEIFVAETATGMLAHGDYWVPRFHGRVRLEKPPLAYWLAAGAHAVAAGASPVVDELEARLPELLAGGLLVLITFGLARRSFGDVRIAWLAAAVFATSFDFFDYARSARSEMLYALFCVVLMLGVASALARDEQGRSPLPGAALGALGLCGSLFAKGPQLPAFLLLGAWLALRLRARARSSWRILRPELLALGVVPPLAWFGVIALRVDGAVGVWAHELVQDKPFPLLLRPLRFYFPAVLVMGLLPWAAGAVLACVQAWRRRSDTRVFLLASCIVVSLFGLGFSGKLRPHYVLPLVPLGAVLVAFAFVSAYDEAKRDARVRRWLRTAVACQLGLVGVLAVVAGVQAARVQALVGGASLAWLAPWLALAAAGTVAAGWRWRAGDAGRAAALAVLAVGLTWTGVAVSGTDRSSRWVFAQRFAHDVRAAVAEAGRGTAGPAVFFDAGERAPVLYYGRVPLGELRLERWKQERQPGQPAPLFVTRRERAAETGVGGEIIAAQPLAGRSDRMILLRPGPTPASSAP